MVFNALTDVSTDGSSLFLICRSLSLQNLNFVGKQMKMSMRLTIVLERSDSCDKRLVDLLGDSSKRRLRVSIVLAVLVDRGRPLCPLFLSPPLPVSLRRLIVSLLGGFLPGKSLLNCRWVRTTDFVAKYASTIFTLSCTVYRVVGSIDALGWKSKVLSMIYLKMKEIC